MNDNDLKSNIMILYNEIKSELKISPKIDPIVSIIINHCFYTNLRTLQI